MIVRTYGFPGCFTRPTGDLDSQLSPRYVHVEACRPREVLHLKSSLATAERQPFSHRSAAPVTIEQQMSIDFDTPRLPAYQQVPPPPPPPPPSRPPQSPLRRAGGAI